MGEFDIGSGSPSRERGLRRLVGVVSTDRGDVFGERGIPIDANINLSVGYGIVGDAKIIASPSTRPSIVVEIELAPDSPATKS